MKLTFNYLPLSTLIWGSKELAGCRTKHLQRIRQRKECESRGDMSSGSLESCSQVGGWGGMLCHSVEKGCVCVCVCNWSAVAGDLLWRGRMREGLTRLGCPKSTQTQSTHSHTHSQGSETLQIETSPLCPPLCSLDLRVVDPQMACYLAEWVRLFRLSHRLTVTFKRLRRCRIISWLSGIWIWLECESVDPDAADM